ncbi:hypothetical protein GGX14DRAFT_408965 [Mycena pura]|uniref:Uncharacterized protein n=1 Tax=Mycena pura TaxID=153505 RepID=A0AAD6US15_9AGAR|nr:hypothetical protein GGX14DRAFT_408965 [Mycena pura]
MTHNEWMQKFLNYILGKFGPLHLEIVYITWVQTFSEFPPLKSDEYAYVIIEKLGTVIEGNNEAVSAGRPAHGERRAARSEQRETGRQRRVVGSLHGCGERRGWRRARAEGSGQRETATGPSEQRPVRRDEQRTRVQRAVRHVKWRSVSNGEQQGNGQVTSLWAFTFATALPPPRGPLPAARSPPPIAAAAHRPPPTAYRICRPPAFRVPQEPPPAALTRNAQDAPLSLGVLRPPCTARARMVLPGTHACHPPPAALALLLSAARRPRLSPPDPPLAASATRYSQPVYCCPLAADRRSPPLAGSPPPAGNLHLRGTVFVRANDRASAGRGCTFTSSPSTPISSRWRPSWRARVSNANEDTVLAQGDHIRARLRVRAARSRSRCSRVKLASREQRKSSADPNESARDPALAEAGVGGSRRWRGAAGVVVDRGRSSDAAAARAIASASGQRHQGKWDAGEGDGAVLPCRGRPKSVRECGGVERKGQGTSENGPGFTPALHVHATSDFQEPQSQAARASAPGECDTADLR